MDTLLPTMHDANTAPTNTHAVYTTHTNECPYYASRMDDTNAPANDPSREYDCTHLSTITADSTNKHHFFLTTRTQRERTLPRISAWIGTALPLPQTVVSAVPCSMIPINHMHLVVRSVLPTPTIPTTRATTNNVQYIVILSHSLFRVYGG
jgi:hypothetical protein